MASRYESLVSANRPNDAHGIALQLVGTGKRVLELGAASGFVTKELIKRGNSVVAVEIDESLRDHLLEVTNEVFITDLDRLDLLELLTGRTFDVVLAGDVLEHTIHGHLILEEIRQLLAPGGFLVLSVPNIAHGDVRLALLKGEFQYRETGILDRTHRTFFTRDTLINFLEAHGFTDLEVFASTTGLGTTEIRPDLTKVPQVAVDFVSADPLSAVYQFIVRAFPTQSSRAAPVALPESNEIEKIRLMLESYETTVSRQRDEISQLGDELRRREQELNREEQSSIESLKAFEEYRRTSQLQMLEVRDYALGLVAELGEIRARHSESMSETNNLREDLANITERLADEMTRAYNAEKRGVRLDLIEIELQAIKSSFTWKLGRFLMLPVRTLRRILGR